MLQISESFNRFGVTQSCQHLLVARFDAQSDEVSFCAFLHILVTPLLQRESQRITDVVLAAGSNHRQRSRTAETVERSK